MELDAFQEAAVVDPAEELLIEAPAGSGKTRVLVERVAWLVDRQHVRAADVQVVTFARKAAAELRERLAERGLGEVRAQTFHAWAYELLRSLHTGAFELVTDGRREQLLRKILVVFSRQRVSGARWRLLLTERNWSPTFAAGELLQALTTLRDFGTDLRTLDEQVVAAGKRDGFAVLLAELWRRYEELLERHGAFDFPLLVGRATARLRDWPVGRRHPTAHLQHVLVDEAQDASREELALIATATAAAQRTWVGDPNQAIYAWRGAVPLQHPGASRRALINCYRSDAHIVRLVNGYVRRALGRSSWAARAGRTARTAPLLLRHQRYRELEALGHVVEMCRRDGIAANELLVLARCHAPLERLATFRARYPGLRTATVHAAKGLEARAVVVIGVSDDRFCFPLPERGSPHACVRGLTQYDQVAEEQRLLYVAMTRARDRLFLLSDEARPSPLLGALPRTALRRARLRA